MKKTRSNLDKTFKSCFLREMLCIIIPNHEISFVFQGLSLKFELAFQQVKFFTNLTLNSSFLFYERSN